MGCTWCSQLRHAKKMVHLSLSSLGYRMLLLHVHPSLVNYIIWGNDQDSERERERKRIDVGECIPLAAKLHGTHACRSRAFLKPWTETRKISDCQMVETKQLNLSCIPQVNYHPIYSWHSIIQITSRCHVEAQLVDSTIILKNNSYTYNREINF